jgi:hypothetical protein
MRWIIGDIHGMLAPLESLIAAIEKNDPDRQLMFVGDYVNRGVDSKRVIELLLSLKDAHFIRGNMTTCSTASSTAAATAASRRRASHRLLPLVHAARPGQNAPQLRHRAEDAQRDREEAHRQGPRRSRKFVPQTHRQFIRNLPVVLETEDMFVAHAKWDIVMPTTNPPMSERLAGSDPIRYQLSWGRYKGYEVEAEKNWERTGYFGHTPVDVYREADDLLPVVGPKIICSTPPPPSSRTAASPPSATRPARSPT